MSPRPARATVIGSWLLVCGSLSSCATPIADGLAAAVGVRRWIGPNGEGSLDLRRDGTFVLTTGSSEGHKKSLSGTWTSQPWRWPLDDKPLVHDPSDPIMVTLRIGATSDDAHREAGTSLMAELFTDSAIYFGANGVVDLNWGW